MQSASSENGSIKIVAPEDRSRVIAVLTTAFTMCPLLRWLYPEPERYLRHFVGFLEYYAGDPYTDRSGACFEDGIKGALLWLTDKVHRDDARMMKYLLGSVPEYRRTETERIFEEFGKYHPTEPYWYFTMLGIDPMHQRSGWEAFYTDTVLPSWMRRMDWRLQKPPALARHAYMNAWDGRSWVRFRSAVRRRFSRCSAVLLERERRLARCPRRAFVHT